MDTRKIAKEYRLACWAEVVRDRSESGMNVRDFCESRGILENTYYHWQRRLREASLQELSLVEPLKQLPAPSGWTAISEVESVAQLEAPLLPIEIGKFKVTVSAETSAELLARTLKVLAELC